MLKYGKWCGKWCCDNCGHELVTPDMLPTNSAIDAIDMERVGDAPERGTSPDVQQALLG